MEKIQKLQQMINESKNIVFFGGAGVSTESGIPDFRSQNGLFNTPYKYATQKILSKGFFEEHKNIFYDFYKKYLLKLDVKPNAAHRKLAELEKAGKLKAVITQNIDGLHQAAGSKTVYELHGTIHSNHCIDCGKEFDAYYMQSQRLVPHCDECNGIIKPDIILYEEDLDLNVYSKATSAMFKADMLIIAGTTLSVYPAASLIDAFNGRYLVVINKTMPEKKLVDALYINEPVGETLDKITIDGN